MNRRNIGRSGVRREGGGGGIRSLRMQELDHDREVARTRQAGGGLDWKKIDLHIHTPASSDYRDPGISYLDVLKKAEEKSLDMIAFTDHNSVGGYAAMHREIETLTLLERLGRMTDVERETLTEYRRLLGKITVLPGFEFTATFGFHILGVFPEGTSVRKLEYLLLNLNVPEEKMVIGAPDVGSTSDVLTAYQAITSGGGLAIAAHANSSNGVAMQGFPFGGQTKIAYTQDHNLVALEVTDLEVTGRRTTASFYNGSKPEYPRRMHLIQGSDAHALNTEQIEGNKRLGVGARITEVLVKDATFASLKELLTSTDFTRTRPFRASAGWSEIEQARKQPLSSRVLGTGGVGPRRVLRGNDGLISARRSGVSTLMGTCTTSSCVPCSSALPSFHELTGCGPVNLHCFLFSALERCGGFDDGRVSLLAGCFSRPPPRRERGRHSSE